MVLSIFVSDKTTFKTVSECILDFTEVVVCRSTGDTITSQYQSRAFVIRVPNDVCWSIWKWAVAGIVTNTHLIPCDLLPRNCWVKCSLQERR